MIDDVEAWIVRNFTLGLDNLKIKNSESKIDPGSPKSKTSLYRMLLKEAPYPVIENKGHQRYAQG